jgi:chromosome segregation ATPase
MFRRFVPLLCAAWLLTAFGLLHAEGPDDQFITAYNLIQQADKAPDRVQSYRLYTAAQQGLRRLQQGHPAWNERVINYRLRYCAEKLGALQDVAEAANRKADPDAPASPVPTEPQGEVLTQLNDLNAQIRQLATDKRLLEARLREALTAQPAPIDPRDLQAAVEKITALQTTNRTLVSKLEAQESERKNLVDKVVAEEAQRALGETRRQLAEQKAAAARLEQERLEVETRMKRIQEDTLKPLRLENQTLKQQVGELKSDTEKGRQVAELAARLTKVQSGLDELKQTNERLVLEKGALEKQVEDLKARVSEDGILKLAKLETELAVAKAEAERITLKADELSTTLAKEKEARQQSDEARATLNQRVSQLAAQTAADAEALKVLQASLTEEKSERSNLEAQLKAAETRLKTASAARKDPAAEVPPEEEERIRAGHAEVTRLQDLLRQSTRRETELQSALAQESSLRARFQREKGDLERQLADAQSALRARAGAEGGAVNGGAPSPVLARLEGQVAALEQERETLRKQLAGLTQKASWRLAELRTLRPVTPRDSAAAFRLSR